MTPPIFRTSGMLRRAVVTDLVRRSVMLTTLIFELIAAIARRTTMREHRGYEIAAHCAAIQAEADERGSRNA